MIDKSILKSFGAEVNHYEAGAVIFSKGEMPQFYHQIVEGEVKLNHTSKNNKELIHGILNDSHSIAEFSLFMNKPYPMNAIAMTSCKIMRLGRAEFLLLLENYPDLYPKIIHSLSDFMYFKFLMGDILFEQNPATKLKTLLDYLKSFQADTRTFSFQIPLTRQQLASLTGLRVETTIRTLKQMEKDKVVKISNRKIFY